MKSTSLLALLGIMLWTSYIFALVDGSADPTCISTARDDKSTETKVFPKKKDIAMKTGRIYSPTEHADGYVYPNDIECLWNIIVPENNNIILEFRMFELESDEQCRYDYLEIRDGHEQDSPLLEKLCGNSTKVIHSPGNKLLLKFVTDDSVQKKGFEGEFRAGLCKTEIRSAQGTFRSTNYPHEYPPLTDCTWKIVAPKNHFIDMRFLSFEVENEDQCTYDYLEVWDGPEMESPLLGRFCGKNISEHFRFFSSSNVITARFVTDGSVQEPGFKAEFTTVVCGGDIAAGKGKIMSANYLGKYLPNRDCFWSIIAAKGGRVTLKFKSFELDSHNQCEDDYVEIREGTISEGNVIGKFCGRDVPEYITSTGNNLSVRFVSNGQVGKAGFVAEYTSDFCIHDFSSESGQIVGAGYRPNTECIWKITVPDDGRIVIKFNWISVESYEQCSFDYVAMYEGYNLKSSLLGKFCGEKIPEVPIFSSTNKMVVKLISDDSIQKSGFSADYTTVRCGPPLLSVRNELQTFSSPGYPLFFPPAMTCSWNFHITKPLYKVKIRFTDIDIPCTEDSYIEISTPKEVNLPYRVCRNISARMHDIISTGDVSITFHSGSFGKGRGFRLEYVIADCQLNYTKDNSLLFSPKYPDPYLSNWRCATSIDTSPNRTISLYFGSFFIRKRGVTEDASCRYASLKVYDGRFDPDSMIAKLCGFSIPNPIFSSTNRIILLMRTDHESDALYSLSYTTTDKGHGCGGVLSNTDGTFTSPLYPQAYGESRSCIWYLSVPSFHSMNFNISFYEMSSRPGCTTNYVELYEGHEEISSKRVYRLCSNVLPAIYNSQTNELMLKLVTDQTNKGSGFVAHFDMNPYGGS